MLKGYSIEAEILKDLEIGECRGKYLLDLRELEREIKNKEILDGERLEKLVFPTEENYDIFISHSHTDKEEAEKLLHYLESKDYKVFMDSKIWGSADELLKMIDNEYCKNPKGQNYSYEKRNFSTSHMHSLLISALRKAIFKSKKIIFITGKNSVSELDNELEGKVLSPWILQETEIFNLIKEVEKNTFEFISESSKEFGLESLDKGLKIRNIVKLEKTKKLNSIIDLDLIFKCSRV